MIDVKDSDVSGLCNSIDVCSPGPFKRTSLLSGSSLGAAAGLSRLAAVRGTFAALSHAAAAGGRLAGAWGTLAGCAAADRGANAARAISTGLALAIVTACAADLPALSAGSSFLRGAASASRDAVGTFAALSAVALALHFYIKAGYTIKLFLYLCRVVV